MCSYLILWYLKKWNWQIAASENFPVTKWKYPWLLCSQTTLVLFVTYETSSHGFVHIRVQLKTEWELVSLYPLLHMIVVLALMFPDVKNLNFYMKWRLPYTSAFSGLHRNIFFKVDRWGSYMELIFQSIILGTAVIKLSTIISDLVSPRVYFSDTVVFLVQCQMVTEWQILV